MQDPNWPASLLASAYWPVHDSQGLAMAICVGYFEVAGPAASPRAATVAGLIAPKARWRHFDERWPRVLHHEGLSAFNGCDLAQGRGEFGAGWVDNPARRARLTGTLGRVVEEHVLRACRCSLDLEEFETVNEEYRFAETAGGPLGICAAAMIGEAQAWMAERRPEDLTLFVFEDGDLNHREIRRLLAAGGIERGEPVQLWPRRWTDERGRQRFLRPFEACDLLVPAIDSDLAARLAERDSFAHVRLGRTHLLRLCKALAVERRSTSNPIDARVEMAGREP
jgi:hypothetical protein